MDFLATAALLALLGLIAVLFATINLKRQVQYIEIKDTLLGSEELQRHAIEIARSQITGKRRDSYRWLLPRLNDNYKSISEAYNLLNNDVENMFSTAPAAEWLLDNFYIIQEQVDDIGRTISKGFPAGLPVLKNGVHRGYPRVYAIALEIISHTDGAVDENVIRDFITAYQSQSLLSMSELWALVIMIRVALIENIRQICESVIESQNDWHRADEAAEFIAANLNTDEEELTRTIVERFGSKITPSFVEHLLHKLRKKDINISSIISKLDRKLEEENLTTEKVTEIEHQIQAARQVAIGNSITSLRQLSSMDWSDMFEELSHVEQLLRMDPAGVYSGMDFESRDYYRNTIQKLARVYNVTEVLVARKALECSMEERESDSGLTPENHIGYYIVEKGIKTLEEKAGFKRSGFEALRVLKEHPALIYLGSIAIITLLIMWFFINYGITAEGRVSLGILLLIGLIVIIPSSDIAISVVNSIISHMLRPSLLPKMELGEGIPKDAATMVIVPTLLPNEKRVRDLMSQIESIYLANKDEHIYFSLVGDFKDSKEEKMPEDDKIIAAAMEEVKRLNRTYGEAESERFFFFHRHRQFNERQNKWMGWERKRGAITEFNRLLRGNKDTSYSITSGDVSKLPRIKYVITLDADSILPIGAAKKLVGTLMHPLNKGVVDKERGVVTRGYGLLQPRININILSSNNTLFSRIFAGQGGIDPYTTAVSDIYQDLFGEGIFTGKGIYELDIFEEVLGSAIPENTVLSHDLLEGSYIRAGLVTDIEIVDGYPARYNSFAMRLHRWVRGDWQLLPWLGMRVKNAAGEKVPNPLGVVSRWKMVDNLRRSLISPSLIFLILLGVSAFPGNSLVWIGLAVFTAGLPVITHILNMLLSGHYRIYREKSYSTIINGFRGALYQAGLLFAFTPYQAYLMLDAIIKTLGRVLFTKRNMLEWVTAADMEANLKNDFRSFIRRMWVSPAIGIAAVILAFFMAFEGLAAALVLFIVWAAAPYIAYIISKPFEKKIKPLPKEDLQRLRMLARKTWAFYEDFAGEEDNYLPPDNFQEEPTRVIAHRTSPTNIGFLLLSYVSARDLGYIDSVEMLRRIDSTMKTIEKMEKWNGHLYNWYDTLSLRVLRPRYVSTVDSGNFIAYLMVLEQALKEYAAKPSIDMNMAQGLKDMVLLYNEEIKDSEKALDTAVLDDFISSGEMEYGRWVSVLNNIKSQMDSAGGDNEFENSFWGLRVLAAIGSFKEKAKKTEQKIQEQCAELIKRTRALAADMEFKPLYDEKRQLFSIGYNIEDGRLSKSHYDLLASEARQASYIAVARGEVSPKHWSRLGRKLVRIDRYKGLVSWTGTMFEYLMPLLVMKNFDNTIFDETYTFVVRNQIKYGVNRRIPWGVSESGYSAFDISLNYQYRAFGIPELGLKRGLENDIVIAPYATVLALMVDPHEAVKNIRRLEDEGMEGVYGLYEAMDYTPSRLKTNEKFSIVKSFMAHHQGMSFIALGNFFCDNIMQKRFHKDPVVRSAELLLQEKVPSKVTFTKEHKIAVLQKIDRDWEEESVVRRYGLPTSVLPNVHILSNGNYSVMLTDSGLGYSKHHEMAVSRWNWDLYERKKGIFIFVKNIKSNEVWSAAYEPLRVKPNRYRTIFSPDKAEFIRRDGTIETHTQITVSPEDNAEIRKVSITNLSQHVSEIEVTSYFEVVLAPQDADIAHPAFSNLFIRTEFLRDRDSIIASRRPRIEGHNVVWAVHTMAVEGEATSETQYETNRFKFIGRNRDITNPLALDIGQPLSNSEGAVLDPVMSLRKRIKIEPGKTVRVCYTVATAESRNKAVELADKYSAVKASTRAFELAWTRSQIEARYLGLKALDEERYLNMIPKILFQNEIRRMQSEYILKNTKGQPGLWPYGVSGDLPVVLLSIEDKEDIDTVVWMLKAHEFWRLKGLQIDLVIMLEQESSYTQPLHDAVMDAVASSHARELVDQRSGVFIRNSKHMPPEDANLFYTVARLIIKAGERFGAAVGTGAGVGAGGAGDSSSKVRGTGDSSSKVRERAVGDGRTGDRIGDRTGDSSAKIRVGGSSADGDFAAGDSAVGGSAAGDSSAVYEVITGKKTVEQTVPRKNMDTMCRTDNTQNLMFFNRLGGFSSDGKEYIIKICNGHTTPVPWINVVSNRGFGFHVSEVGAGYTWAENGRENKITPWSNDPVSDPHGEVTYVRDEEDGDFWSITPMPIREQHSYTVRHGHGYSVFEQSGRGIEQKLTMFVAVEDPVKLNIVNLKNTSHKKRSLTVTFYLRPVLGVHEQHTSQYIVTGFMEEANAIMATNSFNTDFPGRVMFAGVSEENFSYTGDRIEFLGNGGSIRNPQALKAKSLSGRLGAGYDPCVALQVYVELEKGQEKELVFMLGQAMDRQHAAEIIHKYKPVSEVRSELERAVQYWRNMLGTIQVSTPDTSMDILLNGWLLYQVISCRLWARSAFYQSGGAFGFRDQLQDVMAVVHAWPQVVRRQILLHSEHQFLEGDVQHWWHAEAGKGIRTKYSDDLLWLPYVTADYIENTGDWSVLDEEAEYLQSPVLGEHEDERYEVPLMSGQIGTVYEHCIRAIEKSLKFGERGIPLMGCGDWNDGMNTVGNKGKGESVWLGWFIYTVLQKFIPICRQRQDEDKVKRYKEMSMKIVSAIEENAWDGNWYRRAYFDDGTPLGSTRNKECSIDSISQSWSAISGAGKPDRVQEALNAVEKHLIDTNEGIIKLLTPPFDNSDLHPGYIKGYVPGVRENGGQYSHAATWVILAFAKLGRGDRAWELFNMINPINHSRTPIEYNRYKVEPYVMAADVYAVPPHTGRGGWSWYTGAAGWMYRVGIEHILGIKKAGESLQIDPCIPKSWCGYNVIYRNGETVFDIEIQNPDGVSKGVKSVNIDGAESPDLKIPLTQDGKTHKVQVLMG